MWEDKEIWASESQGEAGCGGRGRKEISGNRNCKEVWKLGGFGLSLPNRLSDPWIVCLLKVCLLLDYTYYVVRLSQMQFFSCLKTFLRYPMLPGMQQPGKL